MPKSKQGRGSCVCGGVGIRIANMGKSVDACHCDICRKWGGGPYMAVDCGTDVVFDGEENIKVFDSSEWAQRGFCRHCGSHLFYQFKGSHEYMMPAGLFDDQNFVFENQVFIDEKPAFYSFANNTRDMTAAECFAEYGVTPE